MRAIVTDGERVILRNVGRPSPGPGQLLIEVRATALNRIDLTMAKGATHGSAGGTGVPLGVEWSGTVAELGEGVQGWQIGDRVMGAGIGSFAEFTLAYAPMIYPIPDHLSFEQAAAIPVGLQTMHDAIATNGTLEPGQTVIIHGAGSGVGIAGMQVAKALGAKRVIGTSTSPDRFGRLKELGADLVVDSRDSGWVRAVLDATDGVGADLLIDMVAGPTLIQSLSATRIGGRIVNVGRVAGEQGEFDFDLHSYRRISYIGVSFRTRSGPEVAAVVARARQALEPSLASGAIRMPVDRTFVLDEAQLALDYMAQNRHLGKIVLTVNTR